MECAYFMVYLNRHPPAVAPNHPTTKQENTPAQLSKMPTSPTPKECLNPPVTIAVVGVEKKPDKQFPVVVKGFPINWEDKI
jgi:hypothetical protein